MACGALGSLDQKFCDQPSTRGAVADAGNAQYGCEYDQGRRKQEVEPVDKVALSVEDDNGAYGLLEMGFREVGANVKLFRVRDGESALQFLRKTGAYANAPTPNLVLLDVNLPRLSGFGVLEALRDDPTVSHVTFVVFSSSRLDHDRAK